MSSNAFDLEAYRKYCKMPSINYSAHPIMQELQEKLSGKLPPAYFNRNATCHLLVVDRQDRHIGLVFTHNRNMRDIPITMQQEFLDYILERYPNSKDAYDVLGAIATHEISHHAHSNIGLSNRYNRIRQTAENWYKAGYACAMTGSTMLAIDKIALSFGAANSITGEIGYRGAQLLMLSALGAAGYYFNRKKAEHISHMLEHSCDTLGIELGLTTSKSNQKALQDVTDFSKQYKLSWAETFSVLGFRAQQRMAQQKIKLPFYGIISEIVLSFDTHPSLQQRLDYIDRFQESLNR